MKDKKVNFMIGFPCCIIDLSKIKPAINHLMLILTARLSSDQRYFKPLSIHSF